MSLEIRLTRRESELVEQALRDYLELLASEGLKDDYAEIAVILEKIEVVRSGS
jgi:hypothetical protein